MDARLRAAIIAACAVISPVTANGHLVGGASIEGVGAIPASEATVAQLAASFAAKRDAQLPARQIASSMTLSHGLVTSSLSSSLRKGPLMTFQPDAMALAASRLVVDEVVARDGQAPAEAYGPIIAQTAVPGARMTIVASRGAENRTVHALIQKEGELVSWIRLPLRKLPEAAFLISNDRIICVGEAADGMTELLALDYRGAVQARRILDELLPLAGFRSEEPLSLMMSPSGPCLGVPLTCGSMALVEAEGVDGKLDDAGDFHVCSVMLSDKLACGVDAWLDQARQLDRAGDPVAAKYALEAAIETDPGDARGYRELALFYRRRGDTALQLKSLQAGVTHLHAEATGVAADDWQVGTPAARLTLDYLKAVRVTKDKALTEDVLDMALDLYPCMEQVVLTRATVWIEQGEVGKAIASLRVALGQLDPNADLAAAHHDVGRFLKRNGQPEAALNFCEDAFALGDQSEFLLRGLAELSLELGRPERSAEWLTVLADRWRSVDRSDADTSRAERARVRLDELEHEIAQLRVK